MKGRAVVYHACGLDFVGNGSGHGEGCEAAAEEKMEHGDAGRMGLESWAERLGLVV